jgi:predicted DNA binding protein
VPAEELGISQQALGSRLRRANRRLIEREIIDSP